MKTWLLAIALAGALIAACSSNASHDKNGTGGSGAGGVAGANAGGSGAGGLAGVIAGSSGVAGQAGANAGRRRTGRLELGKRRGERGGQRRIVERRRRR
jgi:hypothetical protein